MSGKPTNETVRTIALSEWVVILEAAFDEAEDKLYAFLRAAMEPNGSRRNSMYKVLLEEFCGIVTVSLWPEALVISRARQKSFKRLYHTRLYNAVDSKYYEFHKIPFLKCDELSVKLIRFLQNSV